MFERFTDRARRVVVLAQEEARRLDHGFIGTEHLLLGLIAEGEGVGAKALRQLGISLERVRGDVERIIGRGSAPVTDQHIPFTPRSKRSLEAALRESNQLAHNYIGTEHVLLGLLHDDEGVAAKILLGVTGGLGVVRNTVLQLLAGYTAATAQPVERVGSLGVESFSPGLRAALEVAAARVPEGAIVGSHHVLAVFAEWDDLAARQVLDAGGFDVSKLDTPIADWPVADTRDETSQQWALRVTDLAMEGDALTIRIKDAALRERITAALAGDDPGVRDLFNRAIRELRSRPISD